MCINRLENYNKSRRNVRDGGSIWSDEPSTAHRAAVQPSSTLPLAASTSTTVLYRSKDTTGWSSLLICTRWWWKSALEWQQPSSKQQYSLSSSSISSSMWKGSNRLGRWVGLLLRCGGISISMSQIEGSNFIGTISSSSNVYSKEDLHFHRLLTEFTYLFVYSFSSAFCCCCCCCECTVSQ